MDDEALAELVRAMCSDGRLPMVSQTTRALEGRGSGRRTCNVCGDQIEFGAADFLVTVDGRTLWLHRRCFQAWSRECADAVTAPASASTSVDDPQRCAVSSPARRRSRGLQWWIVLAIAATIVVAALVGRR